MNRIHTNIHFNYRAPEKFRGPKSIINNTIHLDEFVITKYHDYCSLAFKDNIICETDESITAHIIMYACNAYLKIEDIATKDIILAELRKHIDTSLLEDSTIAIEDNLADTLPTEGKLHVQHAIPENSTENKRAKSKRTDRYYFKFWINDNEKDKIKELLARLRKKEHKKSK